MKLFLLSKHPIKVFLLLLKQLYIKYITIELYIYLLYNNSLN